MTQMPEADIDYEEVERQSNEIGDIIYSKPHRFKKAKWVVYEGKRNGLKQYSILDNFDSAVIISTILKKDSTKK